MNDKNNCFSYNSHGVKSGMKFFILRLRRAGKGALIIKLTFDNSAGESTILLKILNRKTINVMYLTEKPLRNAKRYGKRLWPHASLF